MFPLLFFSKWTTLVGDTGGTVYYSPIFDVAEFSRIDFQALSAVISDSGTVTAELESSSDGENWATEAAQQTCTAGTVKSFSSDNPPRFVRLKVTVTASTTHSVAPFFALGEARA